MQTRMSVAPAAQVFGKWVVCNLGMTGPQEGAFSVPFTVSVSSCCDLMLALTSLDLGWNDLGEGGGWAMAEALRLNTTVTSLNLRENDLREGGAGARRGTAPKHHGDVALPWLEWPG